VRTTSTTFLALGGSFPGGKLKAAQFFCGEHSIYKQQQANAKGAITSKIKHAIKQKTSLARLAQLLQPSLAFCFSLQPMTAYRPVRRHWLQAKTKC